MKQNKQYKKQRTKKEQQGQGNKTKKKEKSKFIRNSQKSHKGYI